MAAILAVDDSAVMRKLLREALSTCDHCTVQTVPDAGLALSIVQQSMPDLIILDIEMPGMDGLELLKRIREINASVPVFMFSSLTDRGTDATIESLMLGATDYATKPSNSRGVEAAVGVIRDQLLPKLQMFLARSTPYQPASARTSEGLSAWGPSLASHNPVEIVAIGSSTGGPNALAEVVPRLPKELPVPVVIVQHMPPVFTRFLAERLNALSGLSVAEARGGERLAAGHVWIAPGDHHLMLRRDGTDVWLETGQGPQENSCRPSVDVLFRSVDTAYPGSALGVVLTGMGQDGLLGAQKLAASGSAIFAQDEASSVIWGMPGYIAKAGIADKVLPLAEIAEEIFALTLQRPRRVPDARQESFLR